MTEYAAFISYSHADQRAVRWLHNALETFRMPKKLVGEPSLFGPVPRRLPPVFRDRDELTASGDLGENLRAALASSRFLVVLCSPNAARSKWVNEEIISFKRLHGEVRCLAFIVDGNPYSGDADECFPPALRHRLGPDGELSHQPAEPIAADMRPGKDGKRLALLKLIAGIAGVKLDALVRRDAARRQRRLIWLTSASMLIAVLTLGLAIYAEAQRRTAVRQRLLADRSLDFLIGTFAIANPATENPRTITALTILDRASRRAGVELRDEPAVSARLLRATGEIYFNLGLVKEAENNLNAALARGERSGEERALTLLKLANVAYKRGDLPASRRAIDGAAGSYSPGASFAPELDARIEEARGLAEILSGHYDLSAKWFGNAASSYQRMSGDHREALGRVWMNQAQSLVRLRRFAEAEKLFARAEASYSAAFGPNHVLTATAFQNQALADFESMQIPRAAQRIRSALVIYDRALEGDHPTIGSALILMGRIKTAQGDSKGALEAFERALGIYMRLFGAQNAAVGDVEFYAAEAEARRGATAAALGRLAHAKTIYNQAYGAEDPDQVELLLMRARVLAAAGRQAEAKANCGAAIRLQARLDPSSKGTTVTQQTCAGLSQQSAFS